MANFHITLISPSGNIHVACFRESIILLKSSIEEIGHNCTFKANQFDLNSVNIVIGAHLLNPTAIPKNCKYIVYQFEQLSDSEGWFNGNLHKVLSGAIAVWDYSKDNVKFLKDKNINAKYLAMGYNENLQLINIATKKDIDILFYGSLNDRRKKIILQIEKITGKKVNTLFGIYSEKRDELIARSKVVLNLHFYEAQIFEVVRVSYLLNNRVAVVSEHSNFYPYKKIPLFLESNIERLGQEVLRLLENENLREVYSSLCYDAFKKEYPMSEILAKIL